MYASKPHVPDYAIRVSDSAVYRIVTDQLGSVMLVVNATDETDVLLAARYTAFGEQEVLQGAADAVPFGFAGGLYDGATGLTRFGARDYDPQTGRWTAKDPILWASGQSNFFEYVGNDPINWIDPKGLQTGAEALPAGAAAGAGGGAAGAAAAGGAVVLAGAAGFAIGWAIAPYLLDDFIDWLAKPRACPRSRYDGDDDGIPDARPPSKNWCLDAALQGPFGWGQFCDSFTNKAMKAKCHSKTYTGDQEKTNWCNNYF